MKSVIKLTLSGDTVFFEDKEFSLERERDLQNIADIITKNHQRSSTAKEVCEIFVNKVKASLGINLEQIRISFVVRINM